MTSADMPDAVKAMLGSESNAPTAPLDEFLAVYEQDDNVWWMIGGGHHMNLFDAAVDQLEDARREIAWWRERWPLVAEIYEAEQRAMAEAEQTVKDE